MPAISVSRRFDEFVNRGIDILRWPDDVRSPRVGERVAIFDRDLELSQHDVVKRKGRNVVLGPAIPWRHEPRSAQCPEIVSYEWRPSGVVPPGEAHNPKDES